MNREWQTPELFRACGLGDGTAWAELIHRFHPPIRLVVLRVCRRFGLQRELEQVLNDVWGDLYERRERVFLPFQPQWPGAELPYLKTVAARSAHDHCRRLSRGRVEQLSEAVSDGLLAPAPADGAILSGDEAERLLRKGLGSSSHTDRDLQIFRLYYRFGFTSAEVAKLPGIGLSESGVESVLVTCRKILRIAVKPD